MKADWSFYSLLRLGHITVPVQCLTLTWSPGHRTGWPGQRASASWAGSPWPRPAWPSAPGQAQGQTPLAARASCWDQAPTCWLSDSEEAVSLRCQITSWTIVQSIQSDVSTYSELMALSSGIKIEGKGISLGLQDHQGMSNCQTWSWMRKCQSRSFFFSLFVTCMHCIGHMKMCIYSEYLWIFSAWSRLSLFVDIVDGSRSKTQFVYCWNPCA